MWYIVPKDANKDVLLKYGDIVTNPKTNVNEVGMEGNESSINFEQGNAPGFVVSGFAGRMLNSLHGGSLKKAVAWRWVLECEDEESVNIYRDEDENRRPPAIKPMRRSLMGNPAFATPLPLP